MKKNVPTPIILTGFLVSLLLFAGGCASIWDQVRENERIAATRTARNYAQSGRCAEALGNLNRASARIDIGPFAKESIEMRIRCYNKLRRETASQAHQLLLDDFYAAGAPAAYPDADGTSIFRVTDVNGSDYANPPEAIQLAQPTYPEYARRSNLIGRVVASFELDEHNQPWKIRVLEMPHPLLATWAIEALERSRKSPYYTNAVIVPGGRYITTYSFEYYWAETPSTHVVNANSSSSARSGNQPEVEKNN